MKNAWDNSTLWLVGKVGETKLLVLLACFSLLLILDSASSMQVYAHDKLITDFDLMPVKFIASGVSVYFLAMAIYVKRTGKSILLAYERDQ